MSEEKTFFLPGSNRHNYRPGDGDSYRAEERSPDSPNQTRRGDTFRPGESNIYRPPEGRSDCYRPLPRTNIFIVRIKHIHETEPPRLETEPQLEVEPVEPTLLQTTYAVSIFSTLELAQRFVQLQTTRPNGTYNCQIIPAIIDSGSDYDIFN